MRSLLLFLTLACSVASAAMPQHHACLRPALADLEFRGQSYKPDPETLEAWLSTGLDAVERTTTATAVYPASMRKVSTLERWRNELFFFAFKKIKSRMANAAPSSAGQQFLARLNHAIGWVRNSPFRFLVDGSIFRRLEALLNHRSIKRGDGSVGLNTYVRFHEDFLRDIEADAKTYGREFFDPETVAQGAINTFAIKIFGQLNGGKEVWDRQSANAISLLHPIVDRAMDEGKMTKKTFGKLQDYLVNAKRPETDSPYEKLLFGLLCRFENAFPRAQVPGFWYSLQRLFFSQVESMKQKKNGLTPEQYYRIALDKGGLSTVLAAYTALGPLSPKQYEFFYRSGGVFQIIDDLLDIEKDRREGVRTAWTRALDENRSFAGPIRELLGLENMIEEELPRVTRDFSDPAAFAGIYRFGFKLSFLRGLARQSKHLDPKSKRLLKGRLSLSLASLKSLMTPTKNSPSLAPEGSDLWLLNQLISMTEAY